jgi:hypothetical protein
MASIFISLPSEILVDLLNLVPVETIINFYLVNSAHLKLFDEQRGFWEQLTRKIYGWGANVLPSTTTLSPQSIDWRKEFRVAAYFDGLTRNNRLIPSTSKASPGLRCITNEHFKVENIVRDDVIHCCLQSSKKLYPLPVGNFTTAYYEVEVLSLDPEEMDLVIGGAIEGYTGYVGCGVLSYGYSSDGGISFECDMTTLEKPEEFGVRPGDIMGFGINFASSSVFFTKNGKLIHETKTNFDEKPLLELKNLHATISFSMHELKVNMGSRPFEFDVLKYQQPRFWPIVANLL